MSADETEQNDSCVGEWLCARTAGKTMSRTELRQKVLEALASCPPSSQEHQLLLRYNARHGRWETLSLGQVRARLLGYFVVNTILMMTVLTIGITMPLMGYEAAIRSLW